MLTAYPRPEASIFMPMHSRLLVEVELYPFLVRVPSDSMYPRNSCSRHSRFIPNTHAGRFFPSAWTPKLSTSQSCSAVGGHVNLVVVSCSLRTHCSPVSANLVSRSSAESCGQRAWVRFIGGLTWFLRIWVFAHPSPSHLPTKWKNGALRSNVVRFAVFSSHVGAGNDSTEALRLSQNLPSIALAWIQVGSPVRCRLCGRLAVSPIGCFSSDRNGWLAVHSRLFTPCPLRMMVSDCFDPTDRTRRQRFLCVRTMSPALTSSIGFNRSEVNTSVPAGKHGLPPTTMSAV